MTNGYGGMKRRKRLKPRYFFIGAFLVFTLFFCSIYLIYTGLFIPNKLFLPRDAIIGCDVSHYQGEIQWEVLSTQKISFAFIKATEGSSHIDAKFEENWNLASETNLYLGAYHFFSFESPGSTQAEHFCEQVGKRESMMLPVVDIEFYGSFHEKNTDPIEIRKQLDAFIQVIEKNYGTKPIIYTTKEGYRHFIKGYYLDCPLWIRSILTYPSLDRTWTFWQYTSREQLKGYEGEETYIDMNVFHGDEEDFKELFIQIP
jgi:lysozyme